MKKNTLLILLHAIVLVFGNINVETREIGFAGVAFPHRRGVKMI